MNKILGFILIIITGLLLSKIFYFNLYLFSGIIIFNFIVLLLGGTEITIPILLISTFSLYTYYYDEINHTNNISRNSSNTGKPKLNKEVKSTNKINQTYQKRYHNNTLSKEYFRLMNQK